MASRRELQRLEDENRTLSQRLTDTEVELTRKEDELKSVTIRYVRAIFIVNRLFCNNFFWFAFHRKVEMLNDLREHQTRLKETKCQFEKMEMAEQAAQASACELRQQLEKLTTTHREKSASSKITIGNFQLEIKSLNAK